VHSTWLNELRSRSVRARNRVEWDDQILEITEDPAASLPEQSALASQVIAAVQRLPEPQRTVMRLVAIEGLSYKEAADVLDLPTGTIMSRLSRARETISAQFTDTEVVSGPDAHQ
jgi:RNA polymerase sigma-70 factor, ECF subfamily